jgi:V8-like Glu-specific endopeptidase
MDTVMDLKKKVKLRMPAVQPPPATAFPAEMPDFIYEKVLGTTSNLKNISWLEMGLQKARSVGRIVTEDSYGTGFLGADGWLYTNHHVLPTAEACANSEVQFNYHLDIQGNPVRHFSYLLDASTFFTSSALDLSRVKVIDQPEKPLAEWGFLEFTTESPKMGEHVTIIQHPDGGRKQVALNENKVLGFYSNFIHYTTDTMPGSSGSPVFDDNWKVVGVHHAGGNLKINDAGDKRYANEAVLTRPIFEALGLPV